MLKVTLFGGTGQGKTTYTLALLYQMAQGVDGFRIQSTDADTATKYLNPWRDFVIAKKWPAPTTGRREDNFKLYFQDQPITDFSWVDYQGGAINIPTDESDEAAQLHADIQESNAVIIVADAYTIATRPTIEAEMLTSATYIFNMLNRYKFATESVNEGITIALVLTKADVIPDGYKESDYFKLVQKTRDVFRGVVDYITEQRAKTSSLRPWLYPSAMLPVSIVGDGNAAVLQEGTGYDLATMELVGPPAPMNVHYPFLFAIGNELDRAALVLEEEESELAERYNKLNKNVLNKILRGRSIREVRDERQQLAETLSELEPKIRAVTSVANKKMKPLI
jgi:GTPase SAR1 family protein